MTTTHGRQVQPSSQSSSHGRLSASAWQTRSQLLKTGSDSTHQPSHALSTASLGAHSCTKYRRSQAYPLPEELHRFGRDVCGVRDPKEPLKRISVARSDTQHAAAQDTRILAALLAQMRPVWENGIRYAQ